MNNYLTINEFSKRTGIEASTLRYWDSIGLFIPSIREEGTNYRYYAPEQVTDIKYISVMSTLLIQRKDIAQLEEKRSPELMLSVMEQQKKVIDQEVQSLLEMYLILKTRYDLIQEGCRIEEDQITVEELDAQRIWFGPEMDWTGFDSFFHPYSEFCHYMREKGINLNYPTGGYHRTFAEYIESPNAPNRFYLLHPKGEHLQETGRYLVGYARGYYGENGDLPERMQQYIDNNHLNVTGPVYVIHLHDEICLSEPDTYLKKVIVKLAS